MEYFCRSFNSLRISDKLCYSRMCHAVLFQGQTFGKINFDPIINKRERKFFREVSYLFKKKREIHKLS